MRVHPPIVSVTCSQRRGPHASLRDRPRRRRGHAHAVQPAQAATPDLRPPDGVHVIHALERSTSIAPSSSSATAPSSSPRRCQEQAPTWANVMFVEQAEQRGTGDAAAIGMTRAPRRRLDDDLDHRRPPRRHAAAAARHARRAGRHPRRQRQRGHAAHQRHGRPDRLRPRHPGKDGRVLSGSSSNATRTPDEHASARSARASTRSAATCSGRRCASSPPTTPRASTT